MKVLGHSLVSLLVHSYHSLICLLCTACFARTLRCAHSFARSLTSLTPKLMGKYIILSQYRVDNKKVFHKSEEKMHKKMKLTLQRAKNLLLVKQHFGVSFCKKIFSVL